MDGRDHTQFFHLGYIHGSEGSLPSAVYGLVVVFIRTGRGDLGTLFDPVIEYDVLCVGRSKAEIQTVLVIGFCLLRIVFRIVIQSGHGIVHETV